MTRTTAAGATTKRAEVLDAPLDATSSATPADVVDSKGVPVVITATPTEEVSIDFLKKYGDAGDGERHRALEELRQFADSIANGQQGNVTPEAVAELKREISWLEAHGGS